MTSLAEPAAGQSDVPARAPRPVTVADLVDRRSPGFDALRLVLAFLVLVSHTWPLGGFGSEPQSPIAPRYLTLGGFAVAGFFAMSGLLVGRSARADRSAPSAVPEPCESFRVTPSQSHSAHSR